MPKVFIVNGNNQYSSMFEKHGWEVVASPAEADLLQFTGGEDVTPHYYGHDRHPKTRNNGLRDLNEESLFEAWVGMIPMAGICRGGQFLNVMSGGWLYQDVDKHATHQGHTAIDVSSGEVVHVSSTHHQMMALGDEGVLLLKAQESTSKDVCVDGLVRSTYYLLEDVRLDVEAAYYPNTNCLCYQPHPEFDGFDGCTKHYFHLIKEHLNLG